MFLAGGTPSADGLNKLRTKSGGKMINKKVRAFWASWMNRDSFKKELSTRVTNFFSETDAAEIWVRDPC